MHVAAHGSGDSFGRSADEPYIDGGGYVMLELRPAKVVRFGLGLELGYARGLIALSDADPMGVYGGPFVGGLLDLSLAL